MAPTHITIKTPAGITLVVDKDAGEKNGDIYHVLQTDDGKIWAGSREKSREIERATSLAIDLTTAYFGLFAAGLVTLLYFVDDRFGHSLSDCNWMFNIVLVCLPPHGVDSYDD